MKKVLVFFYTVGNECNIVVVGTYGPNRNQMTSQLPEKNSALTTY